MDLDPRTIQLYRDSEGIKVAIDGVPHPVARIVKAFPKSNPDHFIGLLDSEGHEVDLIEDPKELDPASRELLGEELKAVYFTPEILEIWSVVQKGTSSLWKVLTDDGEREFRIHSRDALDGGDAPAIAITDEDRRRYRIDNYWELDRESRELVRDLLPQRVLRERYGRMGRGIKG